MKNFLGRIISVLTALTVAVGVLPISSYSVSAADAPNFTGTVYLKNVATGLYLQVASNADKTGANISAVSFESKSSSASSVAQVFKIKKTGSNYYLQTANSTTKSVGIKGGIADKANVELLNGYSSSLSQWQFYKVSDGVYSIRSVSDNKYALNVRGKTSGANVDIKKYDQNNKYQHWQITKFSLRKDGDSPYNQTYGIDVSHWQGDINWQAVKEYGVQFAIISLGHGVSYSDEKFSENYKAAKAAGIKIGAYMYSVAKNEKEAVEEAKLALKNLGGNKLDYPLFFDLEDKSVVGLSKTVKTNMCLKFMSTIESAGYKTGVYASQSWFDNYVDREKLEAKGSTWIAQWPKSDNATVDHSDYEYWQYRSDGRVGGINGYVDMDVTYKKPYSYKYRGTEFKPYDYPVYYGTKPLVRNTDYKITYQNNKNVGMGKAVITGIGSYKDKYSTTRKFYINKCDISDSSVTLSGFKSSIAYANVPAYQNITLKTSKGYTLKKDTDYTLSYKNNNALGTATLTITGKGNFSGSIKKNFTLYQKELKNAKISGITDKTYTGEKIFQSGLKVAMDDTVLVLGQDYNLIYANNVNAGTAYVSIVGKGNYSGTVKKSFKINKRSLAEAAVNDLDSVEYTGKGVKVSSVKVFFGGGALKEGTDFTLSYKNNVNVGTATLVLTGKGNYEGSTERPFEITKADISKAEFSADSWFEKDAKPKTEVTLTYGGITLKEGKDYTVEYNHDSTAKLSTPIVYGIGNFLGTASKQVKIGVASIKYDAVISGATAGKTYDGKSKTQNITVKVGTKTLKENEDYSLVYSNNKSVGTATVTVVGMGSYVGSKGENFKISPQNLKNVKISGIKSKVYNCKGQTQSATLTYNSMTLVRNKDYTQKYNNNENAGTGSITYTGKGNYTGSVTKYFKIDKAKISSAAVSGATSSKHYNAKAQTQNIKIVFKGKTLKKDKDYTLSYRYNKNVGTASVIISGKGNFKGSVKKYFKIKPRKTSVTSLTAYKGALKVNYSRKVTYVSGYIIEYSTDKNFKSSKEVWVRGGYNNSYTLWGLKSKKYYYVRVRTYYNNKNDKKRYYSDVSAAKKIKTK